MQGRLAKRRKYDSLVRAGAVGELVDTLDIIPKGMVFSHASFLDSFWRKYILPFAAVFAIFSTLVAWRIAKLNDYRGHPLAMAIVETIAATAILAAAIGALAAAATFVVIGPALFAGALLLKLSADIGSAIYFGVKAALATDKVEKDEYRASCRDAIIHSAVGGVIFAAMAAVTLVGGPIAYAVGLSVFIVAATIGLVTTYLAQKRLEVKRNEVYEEPLANFDEGSSLLGTDAQLSQHFTQQPGSGSVYSSSVTEPLPESHVSSVSSSGTGGPVITSSVQQLDVEAGNELGYRSN